MNDSVERISNYTAFMTSPTVELIPVVSTFVGIIGLAGKMYYSCSRQAQPISHTVSHIKSHSIITYGLMLIPFIGNLLTYLVTPYLSKKPSSSAPQPSLVIPSRKPIISTVPQTLTIASWSSSKDEVSCSPERGGIVATLSLTAAEIFQCLTNVGPFLHVEDKAKLRAALKVEQESYILEILGKNEKTLIEKLFKKSTDVTEGDIEALRSQVTYRQLSESRKKEAHKIFYQLLIKDIEQGSKEFEQDSEELEQDSKKNGELPILTTFDGEKIYLSKAGEEDNKVLHIKFKDYQITIDSNGQATAKIGDREISLSGGRYTHDREKIEANLGLVLYNAYNISSYLKDPLKFMQGVFESVKRRLKSCKQNIDRAQASNSPQRNPICLLTSEEEEKQDNDSNYALETDSKSASERVSLSTEALANTEILSLDSELTLTLTSSSTETSLRSDKSFGRNGHDGTQERGIAISLPHDGSDDQLHATITSSGSGKETEHSSRSEYLITFLEDGVEFTPLGKKETAGELVVNSDQIDDVILISFGMQITVRNSKQDQETLKADIEAILRALLTDYNLMMSPHTLVTATLPTIILDEYQNSFFRSNHKVYLDSRGRYVAPNQVRNIFSYGQGERQLLPIGSIGRDLVNNGMEEYYGKRPSSEMLLTLAQRSIEK